MSRNKNSREQKEIIEEKRKIITEAQKDIAKLKKQEKGKKKNNESWKGAVGDTSFAMIYGSLYNSLAYRDLKPISKDIYIGMLLYSKGNFTFNYPNRIYKTRCCKGTFVKTIEDLTAHGFIEVIASGKFNRKPNEYRFLDKFLTWEVDK